MVEYVSESIRAAMQSLALRADHEYMGAIITRIQNILRPGWTPDVSGEWVLEQEQVRAIRKALEVEP